MLTRYGQRAAQHAHSLKPVEDDDQTIHERGVLLLKKYEIRHLISSSMKWISIKGGTMYPLRAIRNLSLDMSMLNTIKQGMEWILIFFGK